MQSRRVFKTEQRLSTFAVTLRAMWAYPRLVRPPCPECRSSLTIQTEKDSLAFTETLYCPPRAAAPGTATFRPAALLRRLRRRSQDQACGWTKNDGRKRALSQLGGSPRTNYFSAEAALTVMTFKTGSPPRTSSWIAAKHPVLDDAR